MKKLNQKNKNIQGFTLVELIIVISSLAVIISISYPTFARMFDKQQHESDKVTMTEIRKALEIYAQKEGKLPYNDDGDYICEKTKSTNKDMWNVQLSWYSNLTPNNICYDSNGLRRIYSVKAFDKVFASGKYYYKEYYASVTSIGIDKKDNSGSWLSEDEVKSLDDFNKFQAENDDLVVKYSDKFHKINLYKETLKRIEKLEEYLERYARSKRAIALSNDVPDFDNLIFYPSDGRGGDSGNYYTVSSGDVYEGKVGDKAKATNLAKLLGLPEYFGKDAVTDKPMWYISNPGIDRDLPCKNERAVPPYYPPAIIPTVDGAKPLGC